MLALEPIDPHWLESEDDPRDDQCAHGHVRFEIDGTILVSREDGELTLSAAALFLLRTLEHDHTAQSPVTEGSQLFPCCGFNVWLCGDAHGLFFGDIRPASSMVEVSNLISPELLVEIEADAYIGE